VHATSARAVHALSALARVKNVAKHENAVDFFLKNFLAQPLQPTTYYHK
jgi:hypothetical protein